MIIADEIIHPATGKVDLPGGSIALYDKFKDLERNTEFYASIKSYTEKIGKLFLCTPFGIRSARVLKGLDVKAVKIASPELNHFPLLEEVSTYGVPVILSTGVSTLADIESAVSVIGRNAALLHCITAYPAPENEYNLNLIPLLRGIFGCRTGVSDHSLNPVLVPALSAAVGSCMIEKHFTLSKKGDGLDDPVALTPESFKIMAAAIRNAEISGLEETVNRLSREHSKDLISKILGNGVKKIAESEADNYLTTNRSIHALYTLPSGTILTNRNTALLRTEKILRPGLSPSCLKEVIGRKTVVEIPTGEGIRWKDLK